MARIETPGTALFLFAAGSLVVYGCTAPPGNGPVDAGRSDFAGTFCEDRVDDNGIIEDDTTPCPTGANRHNFCNTGDEPCPSTQASVQAPPWGCTGTAPAGVFAYAHFSEGNDQVTSFCTYVFEAPAGSDEYYAAIVLEDGPLPQGPPHPAGNQGYCSHDFSARRHLWFTQNPDECPAIRYNYPDAIDNQKLSNPCRKMIRNVRSRGNNDAAFNPDIQFFASSRTDLDTKLGALTHAEIGCLGIDNVNTGQPYRTEEEFFIQARAPLTSVSTN